MAKAHITLMNDKPIEAEVIGEHSSGTQALVVRPSQEVSPGLFGTQDPAAVIGKAEVVARALKDVIVKQGLVSRISGKEYPRCEAWTLLGTMLGVFPVLVWSKPVDGGWEARVEARTKDGAVIGAAEAQCLKSERNWANRDDFALRSMAQTRATAKCLRMPLGFVMSLSGFEVTPAEEMVSDHPVRNALEPKKGCPDTTQPLKTPPSPSKAQEKAIPFPTEDSRRKMINALKANPGEPNREIVTEYFLKLENPAQLMPNESLEDLPLRFVPATTGQMRALLQKIAEFGDQGLPASAAFPPHPEPDKPAPQPEKPAPETPKPQDSEAWRDFIIPIPPKGMKRDSYLKSPQTIGQLFELRHGSDDEAQSARQRLWGFVNHFEAKPWVGKDGKERPPNATDTKFREMLDLFAAWFEKNHPDEKL